MNLDWSEQTALVAQATGMISVQAACSTDEALARLVDCARSMSRPVDWIAEAVVERHLRFSAA